MDSTEQTGFADDSDPYFGYDTYEELADAVAHGAMVMDDNGDLIKLSDRDTRIISHSETYYQKKIADLKTRIQMLNDEVGGLGRERGLDEIKVATSVCTGCSNSPPDCCI